MDNHIKIELRKELLELAFRCTKETYAKLHVGQVVKALDNLRYRPQKLKGTEANIESVKSGEKMVIMAFIRNPDDEASTRFMIYAKSLETGRPMHCHTTDVLPCAFLETFSLFRN